MKESGMLLFPIFFPIILGTLLLFMKKTTKRKTMVLITAAGLLVTALAVICVLAQGEVSFTLFQLTTLLPIYFKADAVGRLFVSVVTIVWCWPGSMDSGIWSMRTVIKGISAFTLLCMEFWWGWIFQET